MTTHPFVHFTIRNRGVATLCAHAAQRQAQRGISAASIQLVLREGRQVWRNGALTVVVGRRDVLDAQHRRGLDLQEVEGLHVVAVPTAPERFEIRTVYRNRKLDRLRDRRRRAWMTPASRGRQTELRRPPLDRGDGAHSV